jgi:lipopolysaccharide/colanic/teichoic acid biosynthesis glycosyltransferase
MNFVIRFFDILFSSIAIVILSPLFVTVSIILLLTGEGKVIYRQIRIGKFQKEFKLFKFVTMLENSEFIGTQDLTIKNDPRILPFGRFLRNSKINELLQLLNVLNGDMTLVGFRPQTPNAFNLFSSEGRALISVNKPGLTGIGSIVFSNEESLLGFAGDDSLNFHRTVIVPHKEQLEIWWVQNRSLFNYFYSILLTVITIVFGKKIGNRFLWKSLPELPSELKA